MLKFKDIVRYICATVIYLYKYIKNLLKMESVYDCARPFMLVAGIFGMGGSIIREINGVRSVRNSRFSLVIAALITLVITPASFILFYRVLFLAGVQRSLGRSTSLITMIGRYVFMISTTATTCIQTHLYCKNLTKVLQILNNTDMMLKQENIQINHWKIVLKTITFGLISCNYFSLYLLVLYVLMRVGHSPVMSAEAIGRLFIEITCEIYFMWIILFLLIIRERFVGVNKLLLQNAQVPSIMQDDSLLRRISLARDIHEQLSEAIELFSDSSRWLIIGVLVPGMLQSLHNAMHAAIRWADRVLWKGVENVSLVHFLKYLYVVVVPIIKTVTLTAVCEGHKNNRGVLTARLRYLIAREEDPAIVQQLKQYIWFIHDTPAGLVDVGLVDVDFTLLFMVIDIIIQYLFVIYSYIRTTVQGETM